LIRVFAFIVCAVIVWSQIAIIARVQLHGDQGMIGFLMAAVGTGAVIGVFCMPKLERRFSTDGMVTICTAIFGLALIGLSQCKGTANVAAGSTLKALPWGTLTAATLLAIVIGFNWVIVPTNFNIATQRSVPAWVKGRAIAMYMTVLFGSFALAGAIWGRVADYVGISNASLIAGVCILIGLVLVIPFPLTRARGQDFTPVGVPVPDSSSAPTTGPLAMHLTYHVSSAQVTDFTRVMHAKIRGLRLRNGAGNWSLVRSDADAAGLIVFREAFVFGSWNERLRFHSRTTKADAEQETRLAEHLAADHSPLVEYRALEVAGPAGVTAGDVPSRKMAYPPPPIDMDRILSRLLEAFDGIWNRIVQNRFNNKR